MRWNIGDNRNLFLKLKTKLGLYYVELRSKPKDSHEKITLITQNQEGTMEMRDEVLSSVGLKTWTLAAIN